MSKTLIYSIGEKVVFLKDGRGRRTYAILPLKDYEELMEDLEDLAVIASRKDEGYISMDEMKRRLYGKTEVPD